MVSLVRGHDPADLRAPPRGRPAVPAELRRAPATRFSSIFSHISVFFSIDNHSHLHSFTITNHYITASRKRQALFALQKPHAWRSAVIISQPPKKASTFLIDNENHSQPQKRCAGVACVHYIITGQKGKRYFCLFYYYSATVTIS